MVINLFRLVRSIELRPFTSLKDSNGERVKVISMHTNRSQDPSGITSGSHALEGTKLGGIRVALKVLHI